MKFFIFSIVLHIAIFIFGFSLDSNKNFEIENIGNDFSAPAISVNFNFSQETDTSQLNAPLEEIKEEIAKEITEEKTKEIVDIPKDEPKKEEPKVEVKKKVSKPKKSLEKKKTESNKEAKALQNTDTPTNSNNSDLIELSHGVFAAKNQGVQGLKYSFISQPDPEYPLAAKRISYGKEVSIKVRFLVGFNGEIEDIKFYNDKDNLGFQREVEKTLNKWKLTPVTLNDKPIKLYFYKEFKFNQK